MWCYNKWLTFDFNPDRTSVNCPISEIGLFLCPSVTQVIHIRIHKDIISSSDSQKRYTAILPEHLFQRFGGVESLVVATGLVAVFLFCQIATTSIRMEKNQTTIAVSAPEENLVSKVKTTIRSWMNRRNHFFSQVIEEPVTNRQVVAIGNFTLSLMCTMAAVSNIGALPFALGWMVFGYQQLKKGGMTYE